MYRHSGTLINGDPVVCGDGLACFQYERNTKMWKRVNLLKNFDNSNSSLKMFSCDS